MTTVSLEQINSPADVRSLSRSDLKGLADRLRAFILESVSRTGGHLSSNLGTVELTLALHYVFNTPHDRLVWDVGHQSYAHKIITGRRDAMRSEEHTSELQSLMRISYAVFCLKKKNN